MSRPARFVGDLRTIDGLRRAYEDGATVAEVVAEVRRRAAAIDDATFIGPLVADLDARAAALDALAPAERAVLPLFGVPFALKDNIDLGGVATTAACPGYARVPARSATAVERLVAAGALPVAKTNLDQFATGLVGTRSPYGTPRNVLDPALVPGGSSSGSATAVAAGVVTFALGTDTAGSGRVPAALNQVVGLKPTRGLVSTTGVVPACASVDCVSVFATSVADAGLVLASLVGVDPADPWQRPDRDPVPPVPAGSARIGVLGDGARRDLAPVVRASYERLVARLADRCAAIVPVDLDPFLEAGTMLYGDAFVAERWAAVGEFVAAQPDAVLDVTRTIIGAGAVWSGADYHRAMTRLRALRARTARVWDDVDVLALPSVPTAPSLADDAADPIGTSTTLGRFTTFTNLLDLAALTLPDPDDPHPGAGLTLQSPANTDATLASLASELASTSTPEHPEVVRGNDHHVA
ncbi:MAG: allophanate hydrolase [Actinomycetota bacterium]|nr:allophanate hydrolase [Actinomycetota bacterium]